MKKLVAAVSVLVLAFGLSLVGASSASADVIAVGSLPPELSILPDLVDTGSYVPKIGAGMIELMSQFLKSPAVVQAAQARNAGLGIDAAETATLATEDAAVTLPAVAGPLAETAAAAGTTGVAVPITGLVVGLSIGNTASRMAGFTDEQVCSQNNGVLNAVAFVTNQVDCSGYSNTLTTAQQNADASGISSPGAACNTTGQCATMTAQLVDPNRASEGRFCFSMTGNGSGAQQTIDGFEFRTGQNFNGAFLYASGQQPFGIPCAGASYTLIQGSNLDTHFCFALKPYPAGQGCSATGTPGTSAQATTSSKGNPQRNMLCTESFTDSSTLSTTGPNYLETDGKPGLISCPAVPTGKLLSHVKIVAQPSTGTGPAPKPLLDQDPTAAYKNVQANYPTCLTQLCLTELKTTVDSKPCVIGGTCVNWFADPNKAADYACTYGSYSVDISKCDYLAHSFDPLHQTEGLAISDPTTGADTTQQSWMTNGQAAMARAPQDSSQSRDCWPTGMGVFNPLSWVLQPVQCAMEWAFMPRVSTVTALQTQVSTTWQASLPGAWAGALAGFMVVAPPNTCTGVNVDLSSWFSGAIWQGKAPTGAPTSVHLLSACPGDFWAPYAPLANALLTLTISVLAVMAFARLTGRFAGFSGVEG